MSQDNFRKFERGDIVMLISGGPDMCVVEVKRTKAVLNIYRYVCEWFNGTDFDRYEFFGSCLTKRVESKCPDCGSQPRDLTTPKG